jgi:hypothetical protein
MKTGAHISVRPFRFRQKADDCGGDGRLMPFRDLRDYLQALEQRGDLRRIGVEVDWHLEMTEIIDRTVKRAVLPCSLSASKVTTFRRCQPVWDMGAGEVGFGRRARRDCQRHRRPTQARNPRNALGEGEGHPQIGATCQLPTEASSDGSVQGSDFDG